MQQNPAALFSQPEFTVFYAQQDGTIMKYVQNTDSFLAGMSDPAVWSDQTTWEVWLSAAQGANDQIVSPDVQEQNENLINDAYMRYLEGGFDTLNNETDSTLIASLALSCPFINGSAVYKARMLYSYWVPAEACSDLELCNSAGYYKGGRSWLAEQNELLNSYQLGGDDGSVESAEMEQPQNIVIAPNPGTGLFTVEIIGKGLKDGVLEVYNLLGQKVTSVALKSSSVQFNLSGNAAGVYYYQCKEAGVVVSSGKLILNP